MIGLGHTMQQFSSELNENKGLASFDTFLGREVRLLRFAGLYSMSNVFITSKVRNRFSNWEAVPFAIGILHIIFAATCELRTIISVWSNDREYAIEVFTPMLSAILIAVKGIRLWCWRVELFKLLRDLTVMWNELSFKLRIRDEILLIAKGTSLLGRYYGAMIIILVTSYAVKPYISLLQYYLSDNITANSYDYTVTVYPTTYPFATNTMTRYIICITWEQSIFIFFVLYWMSADGLFAQLTTHTGIQYRVLCDSLKNITYADDNSTVENEKELIHRLCKISKRHQDLYKCCKMIEAIFNPIMFLMMLLTAVNMCFCAFRLDKEISEGNWDGVIKYLVHVVTLIIQAVIYCGYAEILTEQSSLLAQAAYNCQWMEGSRHFKIILLIIMIRAQKEFKCTAYGVFPVNLRQITKIVNTAGSYFTILKSIA